MRKSEIEQKMREYTYRISKLEKEVQHLQEINDSLNHQLQEDNMYEHIGSQIRQLVSYIDEYKDFSDHRHQSFIDEIYQHVTNQNKMRDESLEAYKASQKEETWMRTFGFDNMIAELQLAQVEAEVPGNRNRLRALKDTHIGEKCFVIGNGPSLKAKDLDKLKEKGIFCFASNGIYNIFDETKWRPDLWGVSDLDFIYIKQKKLKELSGFIKLVCAQSILNYQVQIKDAIYFPFLRSQRSPRFFNQDIEKGIHFYGTITAKLINVAVYMGFKEIYLLGCDHSYPLKKDENGKKVIDTSKSSHFGKNYYETEEEEQRAYRNILDVEKEMQYVTNSYKDIQYFCSRLEVKIYNATRGGELEVFPRVEFDQIL